MNLDLINAVFELGGAFAAFGNVYTTYKDKRVAGVSAISTAWFSSWAFWNIYYYPSLNQTLSGFAAGVIGLFNAIWLFQIWYYGRNNK